MEWILIISIYLQSAQDVEVESIEFNDRTACEAAAATWREKFLPKHRTTAIPANLSTLCVPKGSDSARSKK